MGAVAAIVDVDADVRGQHVALECCLHKLLPVVVRKFPAMSRWNKGNIKRLGEEPDTHQKFSVEPLVSSSMLGWVKDLESIVPSRTGGAGLAATTSE